MTRTMSRLTLRDVAARVGIHPATASRALNESTRHLVSEDTARRVVEAAREMGYAPNSIARSLKTNRSLTVGVVLPDLTNPLFPPMVRGIEDALLPAGFTALIANTDNDEEHARHVVHALRLRQVDGWISAIATLDADLTELAGTPLVLLNRQDDHGTPAVVGDDRGGIAQAIDHLVGLGHRRIAHIAGPQELSTGSARHHAYLDLMAERGLERGGDLTRFGDAFTEQAGAAALRSLLDGPSRFTAVLAGNDLMALGCYEVLAERGLRCPEDVSVVGFNDMPFADRFSPPLTTVRIPHHAMGLRAAEELLARIGGGLDGHSLTVLPAELMVRRSTAPPVDAALTVG
jgi:LacI family transcriptional regulator, galactose operon repressor